jgi:hypothetical protein
MKVLTHPESFHKFISSPRKFLQVPERFLQVPKRSLRVPESSYEFPKVLTSSRKFLRVPESSYKFPKDSYKFPKVLASSRKFLLLMMVLVEWIMLRICALTPGWSPNPRELLSEAQPTEKAKNENWELDEARHWEHRSQSYDFYSAL